MARFEVLDATSGIIGTEGASADIFFQLGMKYSTGRDVPADLVAAHKWFNLAAWKGNKQAAGYRSELSDEMSSDEVARAQREAREWISMH